MSKPKKGKSLPIEVKKDWDKILEEVDFDYIPVDYISSIRIVFHDKTVWDIDVDDSRKKQSTEEIEETLDKLFEEYEDYITDIDFRLDLERVKTDVHRRVQRFIKLNK